MDWPKLQAAIRVDVTEFELSEFEATSTSLQEGDNFQLLEFDVNDQYLAHRFVKIEQFKEFFVVLDDILSSVHINKNQEVKVRNALILKVAKTLCEVRPEWSGEIEALLSKYELTLADKQPTAAGGDGKDEQPTVSGDDGKQGGGGGGECDGIGAGRRGGGGDDIGRGDDMGGGER